MAIIKNINDNFGSSITFHAATAEDAVLDMAQALAACCNKFFDRKTRDEIADSLCDGVDYEVVES